MRTGAIFARGSCRALKWMALAGMVFVLGAGQAIAQDAPSPPVALAAEAGSGAVTLTWRTPTGATIAGYQVRYATGTVSLSDWAPAATDSPDLSLSRTISGLTNGSAYRFQVRSMGVGSSPKFSSPASISATPIGLPGVPTALELTPGDMEMTLEWKAPAASADEGAPAGYEYRHEEGATVTTTTIEWTKTTLMTAKVERLKNGTQYAFEVRSFNSAGASATSAAGAEIPATTPSAPENLAVDRQVAAGKLTVTLDWDAPETGGSAILRYEHRRTDTAWSVVPGGDTATTVQVMDLDPNMQYTFEVRAVNGIGDGAVASVSTGDSAPGPLALPTTIAPVSLTENTPANVQLPAATDGTGAITYSLGDTPALPAGLSFTSTADGGTITGTPTEAMAAQTFSYIATDSATPPMTDDVTFELTVMGASVRPGTGTLSGGEFTFEFESNRDDPRPMEGGQMSLRVVLEAEVAANTSTPTTVDVIVSGMEFDPPDSRTTPAEDGDWTLNDPQSNTDGNRLTYALEFPANPTNRSVERTVMTPLFALQTRNHDADAEDEALRLMASLGSRDGGLTGLSESQELTIDDDEDQYYNFTPNPGSGSEGSPVTGTLTAVPKHVQGWEELTLVLRDEADDSPGENNPPRVSDYRLSVNRVELGRSNSDADNRATVTITAPDNDGDRNDDALRLTAYTRTEPDRSADNRALWQGGKGGWLVNVADANKLPRLTATLTDSTGAAVTGNVVTEGMDYTLTLNVGGAAAEDLSVMLETAGTADRGDDFSLPTTTPIMIAEGDMSSGPITLEVDLDQVVNEAESLVISAVVTGEDQMYGPPQDGLNPISLLSLTIMDETDANVWVAAGAMDAIYDAIDDAKGDDDKLSPHDDSIVVAKSVLFGSAAGYTVRVDAETNQSSVASISDEGDNVTIHTRGVGGTGGTDTMGTATITITGTAVDSGSAFMPRQVSVDVAEIKFEVTLELTPPGPPRNLGARPGDGRVWLSWDPPNTGDDHSGYEYRVDADEWEGDIGANVTGTWVDDLTNGEEYVFELRATNAAGAGEAASVKEAPEATAVDASQVVTVKSVKAAESVPESGGLEVTVVANVPAGTKGADGKIAAILPKYYAVHWSTDHDDIGANEGAEFYTNGDVRVLTSPQMTKEIPRTEKASEFSFKFRVAIGQDLDAEDEKFLVGVSIDGDVKYSDVVEIVDAQVQKYELSLPSANKGAIAEGKSAKLTLKADPEKTFNIPFTLALNPNDPQKYTLSEARGFFGVDSFETTVGTKMDGDRADDTITVTAHAERQGELDSIDITVTDANALPAVKATLVDKDGKALDPQPESVMEGETVKVMLTAVDKDGKNMKAAEKLTITLMPTGTADAQDYRLSSQSIEIAKDKESSAAVDLMITEDQDIGEETLMFDAAVSGEAKNGTEKRSVAGVLSLMITDGTQMLVWANSEADVQAAVYAARDAGAGDDMTFTAGETIEVMGALLFSSAEGVSVSYSAASSMSGVASASVSGGTVMVTAVAEGMADITITAHASMSSGVKILDQTDPGMASIMFPVEVGLEALSITLSGPEDDNLTEGMSAMVTAKANRPVSADTKVMLMRDRAMSTASDADYTAEAITITAGMDTGSTMVMAVEDNMAEDMEELVLYGMTEGMAGEVTGEVHLHLWDAAVPALPVIAQLLLAALMAVGGYRRYRRR